jgi:hypothetical protein
MSGRRRAHEHQSNLLAARRASPLVSVGTGSRHRDQQMCLLHSAAAWVMDRDRRARPIHKQLLAGLVLLVQNDILFAAPALIQLAESRVAIAVRVCEPVLFPEQLLVGTLLPLVMEDRQSPARAARSGGCAVVRRTTSRNPARDHPGTPFGIIPESRSSCSGFPTARSHFVFPCARV